MIVILDYDMGNVGSIANMLKKLRIPDCIISDDLKIIQKADKLILPGVGSFDMGMENIRKHNLYEAIKTHAIDKKKPLLGICLGMQLLGQKSQEGTKEGLSLIDFHCDKFSFDNESKLKVPHMGWSYVNVVQKQDPMSKDLTDDERYYFVHSYFAKCDREDNIWMTCNYGKEFVCGVKNGNIYGTQFHPEKSHKYGMKILNNFAREI